MNRSSKLGLVGCAIVVMSGCAMGENNPFSDDAGVGSGDTGSDAVARDGGSPRDTGAPHDTGTAVDTGIGACVRAIAAPAHEDTDVLCANGIDDDCNGLVDCADPWCNTVASCTSHTPDAGTPIDTGSSSGCVPTATHEDTDALCSDGIDNDCNGHTDCADYYCSRYTASVTVCGPHDAGTPPDTGVPPTDTGSTGGCTPVLTVNEIQTAGSAGAADEWVELYNDASCNASLTGYVIQYMSASGTSPLARWTGAGGDSIASHGFVVIASSSYSGGVPPIGSLGTGSGTLAAAGGAVALIAPGGTQVDSVGYGTATNAFVRGAPAPAPASSTSVGRLPDGTNAGNNANDFQVTASPTPGAPNH